MRPSGSLGEVPPKVLKFAQRCRATVTLGTRAAVRSGCSAAGSLQSAETPSSSASDDALRARQLRCGAAPRARATFLPSGRSGDGRPSGQRPRRLQMNSCCCGLDAGWVEQSTPTRTRECSRISQRALIRQTLPSVIDASAIEKNPPGGVIRAGHFDRRRGSGGGSADRGR